MQNWDDFKYLLAVHRAGTMVAAAQVLDANVATVSRRIDRLGDELGTAPFIKSAGQWQLNPSIHGLLEITESFEGALQNEMRQLKATSNASTTAHLRIGAPPFVNSHILSPRIWESLENHPYYSIALHDRVNGAGLGDMDILLRAGQPEHGRLITRKVGDLAFRLYRHKKTDNPDTWAGLTEEFNDYPPMRIALKHFDSLPTLRTTQIAQLFSLAQSTRMAAPLPEKLAQTDENFIPLDPAAPAISVDIWVAYHLSRKTDAAIQDTVAWIARCFQAEHQESIATQVA